MADTLAPPTLEVPKVQSPGAGGYTPLRQILTPSATSPATSLPATSPAGSIRPLRDIFTQQQPPAAALMHTAQFRSQQPSPFVQGTSRGIVSVPGPAGPPPELQSIRGLIGSARTGVNAANLVGKLAGGAEPIVPKEVTGGLGLAGGVSNIANAVLNEQGHPVARVASGIGGAADVVRGASDLGLVKLPAGLSGGLGAIGAGAGAVAGAVNLAQNWSRMDDTQKALGTASVATSAATTAAELGLMTAAEAIPYVGAVIAVGNLIYNLVSKPGVYDVKRQQSQIDMAQRLPGAVAGLGTARTAEDVAGALFDGQFNRHDGANYYSYQELVAMIKAGKTPSVMAAHFYGDEGQVDQYVQTALTRAVERVEARRKAEVGLPDSEFMRRAESFVSTNGLQALIDYQANNPIGERERRIYAAVIASHGGAPTTAPGPTAAPAPPPSLVSQGWQDATAGGSW